jgi:hypothetical protein
LLLITILTYFTLWLWADSPCNTWAYVPADSEGQSVVIYTGKGLAFIDCGASHEGKLGEWSRLAACQFFAQPQLAILTHPSQEYFNDFWSIASETPHFPVFLLPNFANSRASDDEPVKTLLNSGDYFHNCATGTQILHDRIKFCILFAPQELISFNRNLAQTGGVVLADLGATKIVVASELAPYACGFLCRNYPDLRAQTLIINGSSSHGRLMERLIAHLQVQTLVVTGRLRFSERNFYQSLSIKYNFNFVEAIRKGGVLITGKE